MQHSAEKSFEKFFQNKEKYDSKWNEQINNESQLEKELEHHRHNLENDKIEFEKELQGDIDIQLTNDFLEKDKYNTLFQSIVSQIKYTDTFVTDTFFTVPPSEYGFCTIPRDCDIITKIYLEIELESNFEDISHKDKMNLLNGQVTLLIDDETITSMNILTCIFNLVCKNDNIKQSDNKIQILLFDFSTLASEIYINIPQGLPTFSCDETAVQIKFATEVKCNFMVHGVHLDPYTLYNYTILKIKLIHF